MIGKHEKKEYNFSPRWKKYTKWKIKIPTFKSENSKIKPDISEVGKVSALILTHIWSWYSQNCSNPSKIRNISGENKAESKSGRNDKVFASADVPIDQGGGG